MSAHTPGPWMHLSGGHVTTTAGPDWASHVVADCDREEDAHAIARVPELLAALEGLFEHCAMVHKHWGEGDNRAAADIAILAARSALARARGTA